MYHISKELNTVIDVAKVDEIEPALRAFDKPVHTGGGEIAAECRRSYICR
jgi:hypothetical protein